MNNQEWLEARKKGIGGSDIGVIMGYNKYKTPLQLYAEKLSLVEQEDLSENEAVHFGIILEDIVAKEFMQRTGKKVRKKNKMLQHKDFPYFLSNIDRLIVGENSVLECKTTSAYKAEEWKGDEVPASYILQVLWYMIVGGFEKGYIACLIGGQRFIWKEIEPDKELMKEMTKQAKEFWEKNILEQIPPEPNSLDNNIIKELFRPIEESEEIISLPSQCGEWLSKIDSIKQEIQKLDEQKRGLEAKIKFHMGNHKKARFGDILINWSVINSERFDSKGFREANQKLAAKYMKTITTERLTYKQC